MRDGEGMPPLAMWPWAGDRSLAALLMLSVAAAADLDGPLSPPAHVVEMSAYGYNASAQASWSTFGKSFNLTALMNGHAEHGLAGVYRIDCIGCDALTKRDPGFASGAVCDYHNTTLNRTQVRLCRTSAGDATNWDDRTAEMLALARQGLVSGALRGVFLGDEHTSNGMPFADLEAWINLVRAFLDGLPRASTPLPRQRGTGSSTHRGQRRQNRMLYYTESDYVCTWPYVPTNLTHFSVDDYHPEWMYPGLWVQPIYERCVFPKVHANTQLLVVPPVWGNRAPCASPTVWCPANLTYAQWAALGAGNFTQYRDWVFGDARLVGFDPWPLEGYGVPGQPYELGLLQMPKLLAKYTALGEAIKRGVAGGK